MEIACRERKTARLRLCSSRPCCRGSRDTATWPACAVFCLCLICAAGAPADTPAPVPLQPDSAESVDTVATPPKIIKQVPAQYPVEALKARQEATVVLLVTVAASGLVEKASVIESAGNGFDAAALTAIKQWRFQPARRGGEAVASRIRVPFRFALPKAEPPEPTPTDEEVKRKPPSEGASPSEPIATNETPIEVTVQGQRSARTESRSSADFEISRDVLASAPRSEGADVLRAAPGVYIGRSEGAAVAHSYMLRGFDADHGQDIEFRVGGLPINVPSHLHGQGYSDLSFLIGDVVRTLSVTEGVYDPKQGDFAVAGVN